MSDLIQDYSNFIAKPNSKEEEYFIKQLMQFPALTIYIVSIDY